jgi:arsenite-transporting ATPase
VGKTTISSALAPQLALRDLKVLVMSTDPAHSLRDASDEDLGTGQGKPVTFTDPLTGGGWLHASEINVEAVQMDFKEILSSFDNDRLGRCVGGRERGKEGERKKEEEDSLIDENG